MYWRIFSLEFLEKNMRNVSNCIYLTALIFLRNIVQYYCRKRIPIRNHDIYYSIVYPNQNNIFSPTSCRFAHPYEVMWYSFSFILVRNCFIFSIKDVVMRDKAKLLMSQGSFDCDDRRSQIDNSELKQYISIEMGVIDRRVRYLISYIGQNIYQ